MEVSSRNAKKMTYVTYIRNDITMETTDVIYTEKVSEIVKRLKGCRPFESAFSICPDSSVIDWRQIFKNEWSD